MKSFQIATAMMFLPWLAATAGPTAVLDTTIHQLEDRRLIVERVSGIAIPDPPEPVVREQASPATTEQLAFAAEQWRAHREAHPWIHAGATVYRLPDGLSLTHVNKWQVNSGEPVSFWSSADFSLLAHPGSFVTPDGVHYSMLLFHSVHDVGLWKQFMHRRGVDYEMPAFPEFPDGQATWMPAERVDGEDPPDDAAIQAIEAIHAHYRANLVELQVDFAALEAERAARRADLEANPPQPRDIHLRVSRLTREQAAAWHQHATKREGGRQ